MASDLRNHWTRYMAAGRKENAAQRELHEAIRRASETGMSIRAIAAEIGLSHQRVAQIIKEN